ncbi:MAG: NAD(P)H-dependent oxidoreductase subunit E [Thermoplasmata archaeon]|nr:NAD(P)H-dependent oxidoreductase subunit E [Thermoplasmata archaeon]
MHERIREIILKNRDRDAKLLAILHDIQDEFGYIPQKAIEFISQELKIPEGEIYDTISFYSFFTFKPAKHIIRICNGIVCNMKGSGEIIKAIEEKYGIGNGETTSDGLFTLQIVECIGRCESPPAMLVDDEVYGNLTPEKALEILRRYEK